MKKSRIFIILISLLLAVLATAGTAYGYFDNLSYNDLYNTNLGDWLKNPMNYLNFVNTTKLDGNGNPADFKPYIANIIWDNAVIIDGKINNGQVNAVFNSYSDENLVELIDLMIEFVNNFLNVNTAGTPSFPTASTVQYVDTNFSANLLPGQSTQFKSVMLFANLAQMTSANPVSFTITLEETNGVDIADFAVEIMYLNLNGNSKNFKYSYVLRDETAKKPQVASTAVTKANNSLRLVNSQTVYNTRVYRNFGSWQSFNYKQRMDVPAFAGWSRFVLGPNVELVKPLPKNSNKQVLQLISSPTQREGAILMGKHDGSKTSMRLAIEGRTLGTGYITAIPLIINVSRGIRLDASNNEITETVPTVTPKITIRTVVGNA
ncbi:MAG TPA: hypothetical protein VJZ69_04010 [Clostridia bacterium]|nr:hypothetical protein [Clostridia bacterium]